MLRPCHLVYACVSVLLLSSTATTSLFAQSPRPAVRSLLTGYGALGYGAAPWGGLDHDFTGTMSLVPLVRIGDDILVEGEVELDLHEGETLVELEHAEVHYLGFERVWRSRGPFNGTSTPPTSSSSNGQWGFEMTNRKHATIWTFFLALLTGGCAGAPQPADVPAEERGARVWGATCAGCHNLRPPSEYRSAEWPVIVSHMRTRTDLTRSEARAVAAYLSDLAG